MFGKANIEIIMNTDKTNKTVYCHICILSLIKLYLNKLLFLDVAVKFS